MTEEKPKDETGGSARRYDPLRAAAVDPKQAAYSAQRSAYTDEWMKGERVRLELVEKARPATICPMRKPKGFTP
jgi:hypothetical protein